MGRTTSQSGCVPPDGAHGVAPPGRGRSEAEPGSGPGPPAAVLGRGAGGGVGGKSGCGPHERSRARGPAGSGGRSGFGLEQPSFGDPARWHPGRRCRFALPAVLGWLAALGGAPGDERLGASARWLGQVALWAIELVAHGHMVPTLTPLSRRPGGRSSCSVRWVPALVDSDRLGRLAASAPGAVTAFDHDQTGSFTERVLGGVIDVICATRRAASTAPQFRPVPAHRSRRPRRSWLIWMGRRSSRHHNRRPTWPDGSSVGAGPPPMPPTPA